MAKCDVYDEDVLVHILRNGKVMDIPFCELKEGDLVECKNFCFVAGEDAHQCEDPHYDGYIVHSDTGEGYFPEDFGAELIKKGK